MRTSFWTYVAPVSKGQSGKYTLMYEKKLDIYPKPSIKKKGKYDFRNRKGLSRYKPGQILDQFYDTVRRDIKEVALPHRHAYYSWVILRDDPVLSKKLGRSVTLEEVERALYLEGMLPVLEYGIPAWFRKKYGMS